MRTAPRLALSLLAAAWLAGCEKPAQFAPLPTIANSATADGLMLALGLPKRSLAIGETTQATVIVRNLTKEPITIPANSSAPYFLRVYRTTPVGWEVTKQYPQSALMVMSAWKIEPKSEKRFTANLPVEPDWPTGSVRIQVELNGRPGLRPGLTVTVTRP